VHTNGIRWCESINLKNERRRDKAAGIKRKDKHKHSVHYDHLPEHQMLKEHMHAEM
jgi:hypothetical protein